MGGDISWVISRATRLITHVRGTYSPTYSYPRTSKYSDVPVAQASMDVDRELHGAWRRWLQHHR